MLLFLFFQNETPETPETPETDEGSRTLLLE
jgi:hypothetical protein